MYFPKDTAHGIIGKIQCRIVNVVENADNNQIVPNIQKKKKEESK